MTAISLQGIMPALITPFDANGAVDMRAYGDFIEWLIGEGVHGVVPVGTTGESPTLTYDEHNQVVSACVEAVRGRVPVIAGTGANATEEAVHFTKHAKEAGADAALVVTPYYNKPTDEGIFAHYQAIHDAAELPMILYNVPGRTGVNMSDALIVRLSTLKNIVGVKDATGDLARVTRLRNMAGEDFIQISGEDMTMASFNAAGGVGCISVTANIAPKLCAQIQEATLAGDYTKARELQSYLVDVHDAMFCETSPGPVKYAASLLGKCDARLRLPLVEPSKAHQTQIESAMKAAGLL